MEREKYLAPRIAVSTDKALAPGLEPRMSSVVLALIWGIVETTAVGNPAVRGSVNR